MKPYRARSPFDWQGLLRLIQLAFAGMEGRIDPPSSIHSLSAADLEHMSETSEVWVIGTPPQACVILTPKPQVLYVGKLSVAYANKRKGHARTLIELAESRARALGLPLLELEVRVELVENHAAFLAMGFQQTCATAHEGFDCPTSLTFQKSVHPT